MKKPLRAPIRRRLDANYPSVVEAFGPPLLGAVENDHLHHPHHSTQHTMNQTRRAALLIADVVSTHECYLVVGGRFKSTRLVGGILLLLLLDRLLLEFALGLRRAGLQPSCVLALAALPLNLRARQRKRKCGGCCLRLVPAKQLSRAKKSGAGQAHFLAR